MLGSAHAAPWAPMPIPALPVASSIYLSLSAYIPLVWPLGEAQMSGTFQEGPPWPWLHSHPWYMEIKSRKWQGAGSSEPWLAREHTLLTLRLSQESAPELQNNNL